MTTYQYKARRPDKTEFSGVIQALNIYAAADQIRSGGNIIVSLKEIKTRKKTILDTELGNPMISSKKLAVTCSQFAITLKSGMPLGRAISMIARQTEDKKLREILISCAEDVNGGSSFATALEKYEANIPVTMIEMIRAGEQSGNVETSFAEMQDFFEKNYKTNEKIKSAMGYPIFVLCVAVVVLVIVMTMVIPSLTSVFRDLGGTLPLITKIMIAMSDFFLHWWFVMVIAVLTAVLFWNIFTRTPEGMEFRAKLLLKLPVIGKINLMNGSAQFANTLSSMLASGLTVNLALATTARTMDNFILRREVERMIPKIESGRSLGSALKDAGVFPENLREMCTVGEETGEMDRILKVVGDYYTNEADNDTKNAVAKLEPTLLLIMTAFTAFLVIGIYMPMFTMYNLF